MLIRVIVLPTTNKTATVAKGRSTSNNASAAASGLQHQEAIIFTKVLQQKREVTLVVLLGMGGPMKYPYYQAILNNAKKPSSLRGFFLLYV